MYASYHSSPHPATSMYVHEPSSVPKDLKPEIRRGGKSTRYAFRRDDLAWHSPLFKIPNCNNFAGPRELQDLSTQAVLPILRRVTNVCQNQDVRIECGRGPA